MTPGVAALGQAMTAVGRRILVVDDQEVVHWGLRVLLSSQSWVERCVAAKSGDQAAELARRYEPHVAIVDLRVGDESGVDICARLRSGEPQLNVLLTSGSGEISPAAARAAGAVGFVPKGATGAEIIRAVTLVARGRPTFPRGSTPRFRDLSGREREVLTLMSSGATNIEIAKELHLSLYTVKEHASSVYRKLSVPNRAAAVECGVRLGLLDGVERIVRRRRRVERTLGTVSA